jgi:hypothetical protein
MSAPDWNENPWMSLADLLGDDTTEATLATVIDTFGIQTYDRFGRRIKATNDHPDENVRTSRALDLLASHYAYRRDPYAASRNPDFDPDAFDACDDPLNEFGWPTDEMPDFEKVVTERVPDSLRPKKPDIDAVASLRVRRTYLTVIAAMCKHGKLDPQGRGTAQRIMEMTDDLGAHIDDGTIQTMLREIPDALESRMK